MRVCLRGPASLRVTLCARVVVLTLPITLTLTLTHTSLRIALCAGVVMAEVGLSMPYEAR